ncbi:hypothetical protein IPJ72_02555 [Candidatus Peregrinibacteria bacterium]|nr:MAG: hypothetical protein IPJ72_02555 [Candidatus Peregrinibacteria bacterium]
MNHLILFLGLTLSITLLLSGVQIKNKEINPKTILSLFIFGILISLPFIMVEHLIFNLQYYFVILCCVLIERVVIACEHKWKYLHELIHHNVTTLRMLSVFIISVGFTYSELAFYVMHSTKAVGELLINLPLKAVFALFMHTVLTSSSALMTATENIMEHIFLFLLYYLRLLFISVSHYMYKFFVDNKISYLLLVFIAINVFVFFKHKEYLDRKKAIPVAETF